MLIDMCNDMVKRKNVVLILVTYGGSPHIAYRIARCLQQRYERVTVFISGVCMSAGTLITLGATDIIMSDHGRLGPLDVQVYTPDELFEYGSGLAVTEAMDSLEQKAFETFEDTLLELKMQSRGQITSKTAMEIATNLTTGLFRPIYEQIDPLRLGEIAREMRVAEEYGTRLASVSQNLKRDTLRKLVAGYSSHSFVIDRQEAEQLFENIRRPTLEEDSLADVLEELSREPYTLGPTEPYPKPLVFYLSTPLKKEGKGDYGAQEGANGDEAENNRRDTEREQEEVRSTIGDQEGNLAHEASENGKEVGQATPQPESS